MDYVQCGWKQPSLAGLLKISITEHESELPLLQNHILSWFNGIRAFCAESDIYIYTVNYAEFVKYNESLAERMKEQTSDQWRDFGGTSLQPVRATKGHEGPRRATKGHLFFLPCNLESEISGIVLPRVVGCATQRVHLAGTSSVMLAGSYVAPPLGLTGHRWTACFALRQSTATIEVHGGPLSLSHTTVDHTWSHEWVLYVCKSWINMNLVYLTCFQEFMWMSSFSESHPVTSGHA